MKIVLALIVVMLSFGAVTATAQEPIKKDVISTSAGDLELAFIGHGSLMMTFGGKIIHIDPYSRVADYTKLPKADLIFLTHDHPDHLDQVALQSIQTTDTVVVLPPVCADRVPGGIIIKNGDVQTVLGI